MRRKTEFKQTVLSLHIGEKEEKDSGLSPRALAQSETAWYEFLT